MSPGLLEPVVSTPVVSTLGWTLLHFLWQGLLIGLLHEGLVRVMKAHSPQLRYGISVCALLALMLSPVVTFCMLLINEPADPALVQVAVSEIRSLASPSANASSLNTLEALLPYVVVLWLIGVAALSLRFGIGLLGLRQLLRHADYDAVSDWMHAELEQLAARMGVKQRVRIALSIRVDSPLVVGWLQPVILLPLSSVTGLDHQQLRMVLAHELAHLRRHDHLINVLQAIAETLLFFHPAVYRVSKSLRQEREQCCDDLAVAIDGDRLAYARLLASLEEMRQCERRQALALGIVDQELFARVERLVGGATSKSQHDRWLPVLMIALAGLVFGSRTADLGAPLLPTMFEQSGARQRVALDLPKPKSRPFVPIRAAIEPEAEIAAHVTLEVLDETTANATPSEVNTAPATRVQAEKITVARAALEDSGESATALSPVAAKRTQESVPVIIETAGGEIIHATQPAYPRRAMRRGVEGSVRLAFTITATGSVTDIEVLESEPKGTFDRAAEEALTAWRYRPFMENGVPVAKRVTQVLDFELTADADKHRWKSMHECEDLTGTRLCGTAAPPETRLEIPGRTD